MPQTQEVEVIEKVTGNTKFGFNQIGNATPMWSKWAFRIFFYLSSTTTLALSIFTNLPAATTLQIVNIITFANMAVHGLSKMVGVEDVPHDYYNKNK